MSLNNQESSKKLHSIIRGLYECGSFKFGNFRLKSGIDSPLYIDLRLVISQPDLLADICNEYSRIMKQLKFDLICGVPYTALTMATLLSVQNQCPMVMVRKEAKQHGTKQMVEGNYQKHQRVLIIEDVISSGTSILETVLVLKKAGLIVTDAVVFLDREQSGVKNLEGYGIQVHSCAKFSEILAYLKDEGHVTASQIDQAFEAIKSSQALIRDPAILNKFNLTNCKKRFSYQERSHFCLDQNKMTNHLLLDLMVKKQSNLCIAADLEDKESILNLAEIAGPHIVMLKTHIDIVKDFDWNFIQQLKSLAQKHQFFLFEDRKFADIGSIAAQQYKGGIYRTVEWADFITAHPLTGADSIEGLRQASLTQKSADTQRRPGCLLVANLSCEGNLIPTNYKDDAFRIAKQFEDFVFGFISQEKVAFDPTFIHITPGVRIDDQQKGDGLGQRYTTPEDAILNKGADIIVVGRGITSKLNGKSEELIQVIQTYRTRGYDAYVNSL